MRRRTSTGSIRSSYRFWPWYRISPSTLVPGISSFIRLTERRSVDLPLPDGPISAVIDRAGTWNEMSLTARNEPYMTETFRRSTAGSATGAACPASSLARSAAITGAGAVVGASILTGIGWAVACVPSRPCWSSGREGASTGVCVVIGSASSGLAGGVAATGWWVMSTSAGHALAPADIARDDREKEHQEDQLEGAGPGSRLRGLERLPRALEDEQRQRRLRLADEGGRQVGGPERGEDQRRGLARAARHGEHRAGDQPRRRGRQDDLERRLPAPRAHGGAGVAEVDWNELQDLLGGADDDRQHQDRERDATRDRPEADPGAADEGSVDEQAHEDRWDACHHVGEEADGPGEPARAVLGQEDRGRDAEGHADHDRDAEHHRRADEAVEEAAALRPERQWLRGGEEVDADRGQALDQRDADDQDEGNHGHEERADEDPAHDPVGPLARARVRNGWAEPEGDGCGPLGRGGRGVGGHRAASPWTSPRRLTINRARTLIDRKSTRLNSSHLGISYAVFCLKKKKQKKIKQPNHEHE